MRESVEAPARVAERSECVEMCIGEATPFGVDAKLVLSTTIFKNSPLPAGSQIDSDDLGTRIVRPGWHSRASRQCNAEAVALRRSCMQNVVNSTNLVLECDLECSIMVQIVAP